MLCKTYKRNELRDYVYTVIFCRYQDKWLLCRHKNRRTWENAGGHIEPGESPLEGAKRELYEETGALEYRLHEVCDYWAADEAHESDNPKDAAGVVYLAEIFELGQLPESEMAEVRLFDSYPENITYPDITNGLLDLVCEFMEALK